MHDKNKQHVVGYFVLIFSTCFPKVVSNLFSENKCSGHKNNSHFQSLNVLEIALNIQNGGANVGYVKSFKQ